MLWMLLCTSALLAAAPSDESEASAPSAAVPVSFVLDADRPDWMIVPFDKRRELREPDPLCTFPCETSLPPGKHKIAILRPNGRPVTQGRLNLKPGDDPVVVQGKRTKTWALITYASLQGAAALFYAAAGGNTDAHCVVHDSFGDASEATACRARVSSQRTQAISAGLGFQAAALPFLVISMPSLLPIKSERRKQKALEKAGLTGP